MHMQSDFFYFCGYWEEIMLKIIDLHCDVLSKLFHNPQISFVDSPLLDLNYQMLKNKKAKLQYFAVYVSPKVHPAYRYQAALTMIYLFYEKIASLPNMKVIKSKGDYLRLEEDEIGCILSLEGINCIDEDYIKLTTMFKLGIRAVGLTWNYANSYADGALEKRNAGLSTKGITLVEVLRQEKITLDVSHLSEASFWDCISIRPKLFASHSNCKRLCDSPRNLSDEQIIALIKADAFIGLTFVPQFLTVEPSSTIANIVQHVEHICSLGGERCIGFGSDFDGIENHVYKLSKYNDYYNLIDQLLKHFSYHLVEGFLYKNYESKLKLFLEHS